MYMNMKSNELVVHAVMGVCVIKNTKLILR